MFNFNAVFQKKPKTPDAPPHESFSLTLKRPEVWPKEARKKVLTMIKNGDWVRFTVTKTGEVILSHPSDDNSLLGNLGVQEGDCLISNSEFRADKLSRKITFGYHLDDKLQSDAAKQAIEKKIKEFVWEQGMEVSSTERL